MQHTEINHEKWTQILHNIEQLHIYIIIEINSCSDGITVDLMPPSPGNVWIGKHGQNYLVI